MGTLLSGMPTLKALHGIKHFGRNISVSHLFCDTQKSWEKNEKGDVKNETQTLGDNL
jgi:hypothetical protein